MRVTYRRHELGPLAAELVERRKAKGWTQRQLAEAAGVGRTAVQYWEGAERLDPRGWAVQRMAEALGWYLASFSDADAREMGCYRDTIRAQGDGLLAASRATQAWAERQLAAFQEREAQRAARRRVICGARTRKDTACRNKSEPGKRRCKFHGGKSTGARTPEGIERIREAQRRRWARVRESASTAAREQGADPAVTPDKLTAR